MWLVRLALRNPYTVGVIALFLMLMGYLSVKTMLIDIFPAIDIPVVGIVWNYPGLPAEEMERRVVFVAERGYSTTVNGISSIQSRSIPGVGLIQIYFQKGTEIGAAISQITSSSLTTMRIMPPAIQPPNIIQFNATNVPVAQLTVSSDTVPEEKLFDYVGNFARLKLFTIEGLSTPAPYGGKNRQINVDVDPARLLARGLSPQDVANTMQLSNLIIPAGTARIGTLEYNVRLNSSPVNVGDFNNIPVKVVNGRPVLLGEVANVTDAYADQTNIVRINGRRATFLNILKKSDASTIKVIDALKKILPNIRAASPPGMNYKIDFDQSVFVRAAVSSVIREAVIAAVLVSLMILFFLGSWRSVAIVCTSIPLAILASIIGLKLTGNSLNIMTLGGLSLAIGMLVDDATVEIENIHRNRAQSPTLTVAILRGANQIALPAIMSTLAICVVFFPVSFLTGPAKYLFTPMALAVVFAMLASYVLSRTLVPSLAEILMGGELHKIGKEDAIKNESRKSIADSGSVEEKPHSKLGRLVKKLNDKRDQFFDRFRESYGRLLELFLDNRIFVLGFFAVVLTISVGLGMTVVGRDFFPKTDAGLMRLHFRAPSGTRIEQTEKLVAAAEDRIRKIIPADELETINSNIGLPISYNLAFVPTDNIGAMDAEILVALKEKHRPSEEYMKKIREDFSEAFPGSLTYFQPADIINQVLNFGLPAQIDVQLQAEDANDLLAFGDKLRRKMLLIPGLEDTHINQVFDYPTLQIDVDRIRAQELGLTQKDVASSMLISLASSSLVSPSFYLNPQNNVNYFVVTKVPLQKMISAADLLRTPVTPAAGAGNDSAIGAPNNGGGPLQANVGPDPLQVGPATGFLPRTAAQTLGNLANLYQTTSLDQIDHQNVQRVLDITGRAEGRDMGGVSGDIDSAVKEMGEKPKGLSVKVKGQSETMRQSFHSLANGLLIAIALVYLLMVVLFQSWLDPFIIMTAVPGALIGILWMLAVTGTTLNVVSLMGSIMSVGIAVSNSILLVSFANDLRMQKDASPTDAALEAAKTRLRPVLMTALAMTLGMIPMSLGMGEGGEQNAPLGRAVIGGLLCATMTTLFVVPLVYSLLRKGVPVKMLLRNKLAEEGQVFEKMEAQEYAT